MAAQGLCTVHSTTFTTPTACYYPFRKHFSASFHLFIMVLILKPHSCTSMKRVAHLSEPFCYSGSIYIYINIFRDTVSVKDSTACLKDPVVMWHYTRVFTTSGVSMTMAYGWVRLPTGARLFSIFRSLWGSTSILYIRYQGFWYRGQEWWSHATAPKYVFSGHKSQSVLDTLTY
jgi:hypothetical protein